MSVQGASAPVPPLGFGVGIVGHRADRIGNAAKVRACIGEVLAAVDAALGLVAQDGVHAQGRVQLQLVSALAEGSDRIAATAALDTGYALDVVLPFASEEYARDFSDEASRAEFDGLIERAQSVLVLDGTANGPRDRAYEAAGVALLDNCDMLIAVWDGGPGRGRGGTREVIEEAARRGMAVVVISPDGGKTSVRTLSAGTSSLRFADLPAQPLSALPAIIATTVSRGSDKAGEADWLRLGTPPPDPVVNGAYPLLLKLAGVSPWFKRKHAPSPGAPAADTLDQAFAWWDQAAIRAAQAFRSAVIVNFGLAALAVVLAAMSVLSGKWKWFFVLAEVVTILLLMFNAWQAGRRGWQERWLESREVAELLRVCIMQRRVGIGRGIADPGKGGWNGWYAGALARATPPDSADLSDPATAAAPLIAEVADQAAWNESTARRMHLAAHRIERFGEVLFGFVLLAAVGWLLLALFEHEWSHKLGYVLTAITAGLPAVATASYGIRIILDFEGTAERAHRIASGLRELLAGWEEGPKSVAALQGFARGAADIMLGDVAAWRLLAEGRRLTIPG